MEYQRAALGKRIYFQRVAKEMTQEQLAAELRISSAAVSKWERDLARPDIEMLWAMADLFGCTIDELAGRTSTQLDGVGAYNNEKMHLMAVANDLLRCSKVSREQGLLALEEECPRFKSGSRFLTFAIRFCLRICRKQIDFNMIFKLLGNYVRTLPEPERAEGQMIADSIEMIMSGERPEILEELLGSYIGMGYRERISNMDEFLRQTRDELLGRYKDRKPYSDATKLLEDFGHMSDLDIRAVEAGLAPDVLTAALCGASGKVIAAFLSNLSEWYLRFISEDMERWNGTEEEILAAQRRVVLAKRYIYKKPYSDATKLLEVWKYRGDIVIQFVLRNIDDDTLTAALCGASGGVVVHFLNNLSDRQLQITAENMENWNGTEEEILAAQRKMKEIGDSCPLG